MVVPTSSGAKFLRRDHTDEIFSFSTVFSSFALVCALVLWIVSLHSIDPYAMGTIGLMSVLPDAYYVSLLLLVTSFGITLGNQRLHFWLPLAHVVLLIVIIHSTPSLTYGTLRYSWAWKHVGIIDYIQRHHAVDPTTTFLAVYHSWPGFFGLNAFIAEIAGIQDVTQLASWAPTFFNLLDLGLVMLIARALTRDWRTIWLTVWMFFLANWVGQDYFSPQAVGYSLYLAILGILLTWFSTNAPPFPAVITKMVPGRITAPLQRRLGRQAPDTSPIFDATPGRLAGFVLFIALAMIALVSTHQLSPFFCLCALAALVIFRQCRARTLPVLMAVLLVTWFAFFASEYMGDKLVEEFESFGSVLENVEGNLIHYASQDPGQVLVSMMGRALTLAFWGLAFLGGLRRLYAGFRDVPAFLLSLSPFAMLAGNAYGGEIVFRVYLFSVPFMAFFAASLIYPYRLAGESGWTTAILIGLSSVMLVMFLFAYYGKEQGNYYTQDEVDAAHYLYAIAPEGSLLAEISRTYPGQFKNYEHLKYVPLSREPQASRDEVMHYPVQLLTRWMSDERYPQAFFFVTRSQILGANSVGMSINDLNRMEESLRQSPEFKVIYQNKDATIYVLADRWPSSDNSQRPGNGGW